MYDFVLPSLGSDMEEGTLTDWLVHPGDTVERGQAVATVDTVKAAVDVEIWSAGTIHRLLVEPGATVAVGTPLATLLEPGESAPTADTSRAPAPDTSRAPAPPAPASSSPAHADRPAQRQHISPAARREAAALGVDPTTLTGTGPQASVTLDDVRHAAASTTAPDSVDRGRGMRRVIAAAMSRSKREIPHYYLAEDIPMDSATRWLDGVNADRPVTDRILTAALHLKAVALAATRYPEMNGFWVDGEFRPQKSVHVGVAVSLRQGGLVAPAIHDAADKPLDQLMADLVDLVARVRAGSMRSSEMSDPTLTVTNLGDQGVRSVFGVIYPPQVALVGFGTTTERPWVSDGTLRAVPVVTATLAADHRVSDGHRGAQFLLDIRKRLQHPHEL
ncbi:Branched-chain alpha-keto acid dehydrogenase subunit E2 [Rhodococcus sp. RD6.2]|uniref:dihydrolipoamide acetyltransferase family protein n=1 Tax=Rhodococcus sp. RD6.2 TaxID=260936 RepID=UPI00063B362F|nr:dihydrolipoamide acetyltransferase family protein [Rhodococcus sp. RD6.2]CRK51199.1 Branched-chain alpha-keto acid dehydrogenase subunit E2 [Rhodococcus sp. RD6.2]